jgi:hypothetical protein
VTINFLAYNRAAWDQKVEQQDRWTRPVTKEVVDRARRGKFELLLTPTKPVPRSWFPELKGTRTLCLASGGGQQGPLLAAVGAVVTVFDNSPKQLSQLDAGLLVSGLFEDRYWRVGNAKRFVNPGSPRSPSSTNSTRRHLDRD